MDHPNEADLLSVEGPLHAALMAAVADVSLMSQGEDRTWALRGVASLLMGKTDEFKSAAIQQCPELASAEPIPDTHLSAEEHQVASRLTKTEIQVLDSALIASAVKAWRQTARVVGEAMVIAKGSPQALPIGIWMRRVELLVQDGELNSRGNIHFMRSSELRLPAGGASEA